MKLNFPDTLALLEKLLTERSASGSSTFDAQLRLLRDLIATRQTTELTPREIATAIFPKAAPKSHRTLLGKFRDTLAIEAQEAGLRLQLIRPDARGKYADHVVCHFEGDPLPVDFISQDAENTLCRESEVIPAMAAEEATRIFVSFAVADRELVVELMELLQEKLPLRCGKPVLLWRFDARGGILPGEDNESVIRARMSESQFGLLLLSPKYLQSRFIERIELPHFVGPDAKAHPIPVALKDFTPGKDKHPYFDPLNVFQHQGKNFRDTVKPKRGAFIKALCEHITDLISQQPSPAVRESASRPVSLAPEEDGKYIEPAARVETMLAKSVARKEAEEKGESSVPVLDTLRAWFANPKDAAYMALLGESGAGKTMTCCKLDHVLNNDRPGSCIYLDLRHLNASGFLKSNHHPKLEEILSQTLSRSAATHLTAERVLEAVRERGALLIWDGLDEVLVHLSTQEGEAFFRQLKEALPPACLHKSKGKPGRLLMACRTQYFRSFEHESSALTDAQRGPVNAAAGEDIRARFRVLRLLPFDDNQIRAYLAANVPGLDVARAFEVIQTVHNLHDLAQRPYCLSIMRSSLGDLDALLSSGQKVQAVDLYESLVRSWLARDDTKHRFDQDDKPLLMGRLAAWMWSQERKTVTAEELTGWLKQTILTDPLLRGLYGDALKKPEERDSLLQDFRTATFIARWDGDAFRFAHTSLQEYFLASHLAHSLTGNQALEAWDLPMPTTETLDFMGQLLSKLSAGEQKRALQTLGDLMGQDRLKAACLAFQYWLEAIQKGHPEPAPEMVNLAGAKVDDRQVLGRPQRPLNLRGANLRGLSFNRSTLKYADLTGADLSGVEARQATFIEVMAPGAQLEQADLSGVQWRGGSLRGARLSTAQIHGCDWTDVELAEAVLPVGWDYQASACGGESNSRHATPQAEVRAAELLARVGHSGQVNACAWSSDGEKLLSGAADNTLRVWEARSGKCLLTLQGHSDGVTACAWSPDGEKLLSSSWDNTLRVWEVRSGKCLLTLLGHSGGVTACAWSPDGEKLLSGEADNTLKVWEARSGKCLLTLQGHSGQVTACAWSPDGEKLLSVNADNTLKVWEACSGKCLLTLQGHAHVIRACAWSPDGEKLLSGSWDSTLKVWEARSGKCLLTLQGHSGGVNACAWSPDGEKLLSGAADSTLKVWEMRSGKCLLTLQGHSNRVTACAWSPDGEKRLSASWDGTLKVWEARSGKCLLTLQGHCGRVNACAWSPDDEKLLSASWDGTLKVWEARSGKCLLTIQIDSEWFNTCAWSPDGEKLLSGSIDNTLKVWEARSGNCLLTLQGHSDEVASCAWSPDDEKLLSASWDGTLKVWEARNGKCLLTLQGHSDEVAACAWSPDGEKLLSGSADNTLKVWEARSGNCLLTLQGHSGRVNACAWSPDGEKLLSGSADNTLKVWEARSGKCLLTLQGHLGWVNGCAWSPNGEKLLSGSADNSLRVWETGSGNCLWTDVALPQRQTATLDVNDRLVSCSPEAWRWLGWRWTDPRTGRLRLLPAEHFGPLPVYSISSS